MEYFIHLRDYNVIVCRKCRYAVLPSRLDTHLASPKHRVEARRRAEIGQEVGTWTGLLRNEADLERFHVPRDSPPAFEALETHQNGRRCRTCPYIACTNQGIQQHCRDQHQWVNPWRSGVKSADRRRAGQSLERPWVEDVVCQRFFVTGPRQEYFEVQPADRLADDDEAPQATQSKWDQARRQLTQSWNAVQAAQERTIREGQPDEVNPWLERTGWASLYGSRPSGPRSIRPDIIPYSRIWRHRRWLSIAGRGSKC